MDDIAETGQSNDPSNPLYDVLQKLVSHERAFPKKLEKEGETTQIDQTIERALNIAGVEPPDESELLEYKLRIEMEELQIEADKKGTREEQEEMKSRSLRRLNSYVRKTGVLQYAIDHLEETLQGIRQANLTNLDRVNPASIDKCRVIEQQIAGLKKALKNDLPFSSPEAFLAHNLLELRDYYRQFKETGIISTDTVEAMQDEITEKLISNGLVVLVGETGTGKTQIAKRIATQIFEATHPNEEGNPYYLVSGHKFLTREDLLSYLSIKSETTTPEETLDLVEKAKDAYLKKNPDLIGEEKEKGLESVKTIILRQAERPQMGTKEFLGPVFKAAQEGKVVIIDEFNYINPGLIASLNELMQTKPGKTMYTQGGEAIRVGKGFGIIFTGNVSVASTKRYSERHNIDPALLNRFNSGLIEYNTLPQDEIDLNFQQALEQSEKARLSGEESPKRELFQIALTMLVDRKGNLYAPENTFDQVWKMTQAFKVFQNNFAGKALRSDDFLSGNTEFRLQKAHASMRTLNDILISWKADNFEHPLEYYLFEKLIRPSSVVSPQEANYFYDILKRKYDFFKSDYWGEYLGTDQNSSALIIKEGIRKKDLKVKTNPRLFIAQEVAEAFSGNEMSKDIKKDELQLSQDAIQEQIISMEERFEDITAFMSKVFGKRYDEVTKEWVDEGKSILSFICTDEANIDKPKIINP